MYNLNVVRTKVVHWKKERYDVLIDRTTKWGNPYSHQDGTLAKFRVATRKEAIEKYKEWIVTQPELMAALPELKGLKLGCWCRPEKQCHGDVLVELIEGQPSLWD